MADDKIVDLRRARRAQEEPSEAPDRFKADNLRPPSEAEVLARLGLDSVSWPGSDGSTRIDLRTLRELRERLHSLEEAAGQMEIAGRLIKTEARTLARRLTEIIGDGPEDFDPRGGAA